MSSQLNQNTLEGLTQQINELQLRCADTCHIIANTPNVQAINRLNTDENIISYVESLRTEIETSFTPIQNDVNLITIQFLNETKEKTEQIKELKAYTKGAINDVDNEIERLNSLIQIAKEAKSQPRSQKQEISSEHLTKAKERFQMMKGELHNLINSMFPDVSTVMIDVLGQLMMLKLDETSNGYVEITAENHRPIELLKDMGLVTTNPYNNKEVKFAY